jgi:D-serine deaminase-like pyridoxal phosphate-dependent protein
VNGGGVFDEMRRQASSTSAVSAGVNGYAAASSGEGSNPKRPVRSCRMFNADAPDNRRASSSLSAQSTDTATITCGASWSIEGRKSERYAANA